nr:hypothetical protein [Tanacetum cinerariifolium]
MASHSKPEWDLLPITINNLRIVSSGVKPSSIWLPVLESARQSPTPLAAFIKANYEALESLLRDRHRQMRNNDLRTKLEYFSEDYDEEQEMELTLELTRAATPPLRVASPRIHRQGERTVGFEGAQSRGESRVERNNEGGRPLKEAPIGNGGQGVNLPPLIASYLGRGENGKPL